MNRVLRNACSQFGAYAELSKLRIQGIAIPAGLACQWLANSGHFDAGEALDLTAAMLLTCSGAAGLNQALEADVDARMERTAGRPIPTGRISHDAALGFSLATASCGVAWFTWLVSPLAGVLALAMIVLYDFVYTPLKRVTPMNTLIGAVPGAMPVLIGWASAGEGLGPVAWILYGILFLWQFPHFMAIAWLHREDYERAGLKMITGRDFEARVSGRQALRYALALVPVSLMPTLTGSAGRTYFFGALALSLLFLLFALRFSVSTRDAKAAPARPARGLLQASLVYLPLLFALLLADSAVAAAP